MFKGSLIIRIVVTVSISDHFNHSNSKVFLCNVYISINITYLNSKFGISSKKNILVSYSQRYGFAFYIVTKAYAGQGRVFQCFSFKKNVGLQVLTLHQAGIQCQVRWTGFRLERCFDV